MTIVISASKSDSSEPIINRYEYNKFSEGDLQSLKRLAVAMYTPDHEVKIYGESVDGTIFPFATKERGKYRFRNAR